MVYQHFIGECGIRSSEHGGDDPYLFELEPGLAVLKYIGGEPPDGATLKIVWADYGTIEGAQCHFPIIATEFSKNSPALEMYEEKLITALRIFDKSVDWHFISRNNILRSEE